MDCSSVTEIKKTKNSIYGKAGLESRTLLSLSLTGLIKTSLPMLKDECIRIQGCFAASRPLDLLLNDIKLKVSLTSKLVCRLLWSTYTAKSSYLSLISCKSMTVNAGLVQSLTVKQ